ncbi:MAG: MMPL family transporter [Acidimicrobiia bacterium]|nr:MMPL family transporter [Acidimicrobiia bacterium]
MEEGNRPAATASFGERVASLLERRSGTAVVVALLVTGLLAIPFLTMAPEETASQDPGGAVFDAEQLINDRFASSVFGAFYVVEARAGNVLTRDPMLELFENSADLRADPEVGPKLLSYFDADLGVDIQATYTIADAADALLRSQGVGGLAAAGDEQVGAAVGILLQQRPPSEWGLSVEANLDSATRRWTSPAVFVTVLADNLALGGGGQGVRLGGGTEAEDKEKFAREIQSALRGDESHNQVWGVAIDVNLTSGEQGNAAGPFIGFTILAVLLVVGVVFRSYWAVAITGGALAVLVVWLKGFSNLIGLKSDLILDLIVPIAMVSFGVDFAFHAIGRYREERATGLTPRPALVAGLAAVLGALTLALASDSAAFLSNVSSPLESIIQFGVATAVALTAAFVMLGLIAPVVLTGVETRVGVRALTRTQRFLAANAIGLAATGTMATVLFMVYINPPVGVALLPVYLSVFLGVPYLIGRRTVPAEVAGTAHRMSGAGSPRIGRMIVTVARRRALLLPIVAVGTALAAFFALQIEARFDVADFFAGDTDFVVGLDKLDRHAGETSGEGATIYVEGNLNHPAAVTALDGFVADVRRLDTPSMAKSDNGDVAVFAGHLEVLNEVMGNPVAMGAIQATTGVPITDDDGDGYPDTSEQLAAVADFTRQNGVPLDQSRLAITPDGVRTNFWQSEDGALQASVIGIGIVGTRAQENIVQAREALEPLIADLETDLSAGGTAATVTLTAGPITRDEQLSAILRSLLISLPISVILCLVLAVLFMRSLRYAVVSIIPILLVVAWLYAFMYFAGFGVNVATATIGAISIGIGIDFAIHFTMRYRQEMEVHATRVDALDAAGTGTGGALAGSAASSIVGFAILALAPMPMFASYGLLTAVMIAMALAASLLVLPSLLMVVTRDRAEDFAAIDASRPEPATR